MNFLRIFLTETTQAAEEAAGSMDGMVDMLDTLMFVMLVGFGLYALYSAFRLHKEQMLLPNKILYPGDCKPEDCVDEGEFIDFILPRAVILGACLLVMGIVLGLNMFLFKLEALWIDIAMMVVPIAVFAWYILAQRKAAKRYW